MRGEAVIGKTLAEDKAQTPREAVTDMHSLELSQQRSWCVTPKGGYTGYTDTNTDAGEAVIGKTLAEDKAQTPREAVTDMHSLELSQQDRSSPDFSFKAYGFINSHPGPERGWRPCCSSQISCPSTSKESLGDSDACQVSSQAC
ncbi:hypothetical protein Bbelb_167850 [Branchiostoma belcheri]|nr:hypothetical protein Bbelb_167850 [Branchiostoma belcheri]